MTNQANLDSAEVTAKAIEWARNTAETEWNTGGGAWLRYRKIDSLWYRTMWTCGILSACLCGLSVSNRIEFSTYVWGTGCSVCLLLLLLVLRLALHGKIYPKRWANSEGRWFTNMTSEQIEKERQKAFRLVDSRVIPDLMIAYHEHLLAQDREAAVGDSSELGREIARADEMIKQAEDVRAVYEVQCTGNVPDDVLTRRDESREVWAKLKQKRAKLVGKREAYDAESSAKVSDIKTYFYAWSRNSTLNVATEFVLNQMKAELERDPVDACPPANDTGNQTNSPSSQTSLN